jgi:hypothetical protein
MYKRNTEALSPLPWESNIYHIFSAFSYPTYKLMLLIILCLLPVWLFLTYSHNFINCTIRKKVVEHKMRM